MKRWLILLSLVLGACSQAQGADGYPPPIQALVAKGMTIKGPLEAPAGFNGYLGEYDGHPVPVYLLPDGQHAVIGTVFDRHGNDLTSGPLQAATTPALDAATWEILGKAHWIAEGATRPARIVYVFTDTECPYCHKLWQATQPLLANGDVQVRHILVAVIAPSSLGRAAAILDAPDPGAALHRHEVDFGHSPIKPLAQVPEAAARQLQANNALLEQLGISGTPATFYKDAQGRIRRVDGMMPPATIEQAFGPR